MEFLREEKWRAQQCAVVSGALVLTVGALFGNVGVEEQDAWKNESTVKMANVQQIYDPVDNLLQLGNQHSILEDSVVQETKEIPAIIQQPEKIAVIVQTSEIIPITVQEVEKISEVVVVSEEIPVITEENDEISTIMQKPEKAPTDLTEAEETVVDPSFEEIVKIEDPIDNSAQAAPFLIDEAGMLYDVNLEQLDLEWGFLEIPDNCLGIRSGALSKCGENVQDIYIPETVSIIEPNAFAGLSNLGWIEAAEGNSDYCSYDGVLYTADGTGLIAFPAGITGAYKLPEQLMYVETGAFAGSNLSIIDKRRCSTIQVEDLIEAENYGIRII